MRKKKFQKPLDDLTPEAKQGLSDLFFFGREIWGLDLLREQPHRQMAEDLMEIYLGTGPKDSLMNRVPRDAFKTSFASICFGAWVQLNEIYRDKMGRGEPNFSYRIFYNAATKEKSWSLIQKLIDKFEYDGRLQILYGDLAGSKAGVGVFSGYNLAPRYAGGSIDVISEPNFFCGSVISEQTGKHSDLNIHDDLSEQKNSTTRAQREKVIISYKNSLSILSKDSGRQVMNCTAWHDADVSSDIIKRETKLVIERGDEASRWKIRNFGAILPDGSLYFPERLTHQVLAQIEHEVGPTIYACTPGFGEILMGDWTDKPIAEVQVGEDVIGFSVVAGADRTRFVTATVLNKGSHEAEVFRYTLSDGSRICSTDDHKWFTGRKPTGKEPHRKSYVSPRIGSRVVRAYQPDGRLSPEERCRWNWLAGMFDGEGHIGNGSTDSGFTITQSRVANPTVYQRIVETLNSLNVKYNIHKRRKPGPSGGSGDIFTVGGGRETKIRLLTHGNPAKSPYIQKSLWARPMMVGSRLKIVAQESLGRMPVYWLETTVGNYVSQGVLSKNCQYRNDPASVGQLVVEDQIRFKDPKEFPPFKRIRITADSAEGGDDKDNGDYYWITVSGFDQFNNEYVLSVRFSSSWGGYQFAEELFRAATDYPSYDKIYIENKHVVFMRSLIGMEEVQRGINLRMGYVGVDSTDKWNKHLKFQPRFNNGRIFFSSDLPLEAQAEIREDLIRAPYSSHDDFLDTLYLMESNATKARAQDVEDETPERAIALRPEDVGVEMVMRSRYDPVTRKIVSENIPVKSKPIIFEEWLR